MPVRIYVSHVCTSDGYYYHAMIIECCNVYKSSSHRVNERQRDYGSIKFRSAVKTDAHKEAFMRPSFMFVKASLLDNGSSKVTTNIHYIKPHSVLSTLDGMVEVTTVGI